MDVNSIISEINSPIGLLIAAAVILLTTYLVSMQDRFTARKVMHLLSGLVVLLLQRPFKEPVQMTVAGIAVGIVILSAVGILMHDGKNSCQFKAKDMKLDIGIVEFAIGLIAVMILQTPAAFCVPFCIGDPIAALVGFHIGNSIEKTPKTDKFCYYMPLVEGAGRPTKFHMSRQKTLIGTASFIIVVACTLLFVPQCNLEKMDIGFLKKQVDANMASAVIFAILAGLLERYSPSDHDNGVLALFCVGLHQVLVAGLIPENILLVGPLVGILSIAIFVVATQAIKK